MSLKKYILKATRRAEELGRISQPKPSLAWSLAPAKHLTKD
jgi:hypothetical protein